MTARILFGKPDDRDEEPQKDETTLPPVRLAARRGSAPAKDKLKELVDQYRRFVKPDATPIFKT